jgi:hypothetical protein
MRWSLLYGLFLGVISLIKPTAVPLLLLLALAFRAQSPWMYIRNGLTTTLAMLVMWLPVFAYWGSAGALNDLRFALLDYNRMYATESTVRWSIGGLVDMLAPLALLLVCAAGGTLWGHAAPGRRRHMAVTLWTLAFLGAGLLGMRTYIHYYYPALAGLSLLAVLLILTLVRQAWHAHGLERLVGVGGPGMLLTLLLLPFVLDSLSLIGRTPQGQATALYGVDGHQHFGPAQSVADFVRATTMPHETIFIWASEPEIYLLAERQPASRFIYDYPLQLLPEAREELTRDLASRPPTLMITYHGAQPDGLKAITTQYNLRFTTTIGGYDLWTRSVPEQP